MADSSIAITPGTGANVDVRTEATNGNARQVIVIGDPDTNAGVAPVDATAGLKVNLGADNDVTVSSSALPTGASTSANQTTIIGHVDGIETLLGTIDADTSALAGAVAGTEVQVDIVSAPTLTVNAHAVTNAGTFAVQESGAALTALQTIDNIVSGSGVNISQMNGVNVSMGTGVSGTGVQRVVSASDSPDVTALQIMDDWDNGASDGASVSGDVAHDSVDAGEPVKIGFKAYELDGTEAGTAVAEGDRVNGIADKYGRQYVSTAHPRFWHVSADYASAQTNTSVKASPGAGLALYITDIVISNGATAGNITLLDGSGGTVLFEIYPAINGGVALSLKNPIKLTDATALCITSTTVTTHSIFVAGFID